MRHQFWVTHVAWLMAVAVATATMACRPAQATMPDQLSEARRLAAETLIEFTKAADATNRAAMAGLDDTVTSAQKANAARTTAVGRADALRPILVRLDFSKELGLLNEFDTRFVRYQELDRSILEMITESTNLKAQRLSFGKAADEADTIRDALTAMTEARRAGDRSRAEALAATILVSVREIQALQAPHIAEPTDQRMDEIEKRMAAAQESAERAVSTLGSLAPPPSASEIASVTAALNRFMSTNSEIVALSRRNTNVSAIALSLGQKRALAGACEESLRALLQALATRGTAATS